MRIRFWGLKASVLGQAINGGLSLIGVALWARTANPTVLATVFTLLSIIAISVDFLDFGGNAWVSREVVHSKLKKNLIWNFLFEKILVSFYYSNTLNVL